MTEKEYNDYLDRLVGIEEDKGCTLIGDVYNSFVTGVAKCCLLVKRICKTTVCSHNDIIVAEDSKVDVVDSFVPWSMQSFVCEDPGMLDEPETL